MGQETYTMATIPGPPLKGEHTIHGLWPALVLDSWFMAKQGYVMFHAVGHFVHCSGWRFLAAANVLLKTCLEFWSKIFPTRGQRAPTVSGST